VVAIRIDHESIDNQLQSHVRLKSLHGGKQQIGLHDLRVHRDDRVEIFDGFLFHSLQFELLGEPQETILRNLPSVICCHKLFESVTDIILRNDCCCC
jgi:hypothetical protein